MLRRSRAAPHLPVVVLQAAPADAIAALEERRFVLHLFATRISAQAWARLAGDSARPLLDRVSASAQPPASTWKPVVAALALRLGLIRSDQFMPIPCMGGLWYGGRYARCWSFPRGHGYRDLAGALRVSCDVRILSGRTGLKLSPG